MTNAPGSPWAARIFNLGSADDFNALALQIFRYQAKNVPIYRDFVGALKIDVNQVAQVEDIPFLPISFFKTQRVISEGLSPAITFQSSGTTGMVRSEHLVADVSLYEQSFNLEFERQYGPAEDWCILALLPSYLERDGSSLIYMAEKLIAQSRFRESGFYLRHQGELVEQLQNLEKRSVPTLLLGVSYALLDLAEQLPFPLKSTVVMETGGMKGRRKEMIKAALHAQLQKGFGPQPIHSEYGMTELLSQAYSQGKGRFTGPPWCRALVRDANDPLTLLEAEQAGGINLIDLANVHSCSFIATQDLGRVYENGTFEVLGRFDHSDIRGCNLLVD